MPCSVHHAQVDNNPYSFLAQPENGVPIQSFQGDADDRQLLEVLLPLIEALADAPDVRPHLVGLFGMPAWLAARSGEPPRSRSGRRQ